MIRDDGLAGAKRVARGRLKISPDCSGTDQTGVPADPGTHQQALLRWHVFQNLGQLRFKTFRYHTHRLFEQSLEGGTTESGDTKFRKYFLLANSQIEPTRADVCGGRTVWRRFDNRRLRAAAQRVARC